MLIEFECVMLEQGTVEDLERLLLKGKRFAGFRRWAGNVFDVTDVSADVWPHPLVMLREIGGSARL